MIMFNTEPLNKKHKMARKLYNNTVKLYKKYKSSIDDNVYTIIDSLENVIAMLDDSVYDNFDYSHLKLIDGIQSTYCTNELHWYRNFEPIDPATLPKMMEVK